MPAHDLNVALETHFGFSQFREGQQEAIQHVLEGGNVLVVMPTGSGKSLCYQLPAMLLPGVTLVISPLISLMKDQVDSLRQKGIPATFINSSIPRPEMLDRLRGMENGTYKLVYIAPERFRDAGFIRASKQAGVSLIAVDEAHCISQWGHDFRPDYMRIRNSLSHWPDAAVMAMTATATTKVRADILDQLASDDRAEFESLVYGFRRDNLHIQITRSSTHAHKYDRLIEVAKKYESGIVYCSTRAHVESVHTQLASEYIEASMYHAGLRDEERASVQEHFMSGKMPIVIATNAFGMGIDREDVRFVVHWDIPGSLEAYYQEIGRAGRDGKPSHCELLYNYADVKTQEFFLEGSNPKRETLIEVWKLLKKTCAEEPQARSVEEWAMEVASSKNGMAVGTCLYMLERAGLINREIGAQRRVYTYSLNPKGDEASLSEQIDILRDKRARDEKKLDDLLRFVGSMKCRHADILEYFGEVASSPTCKMCSNCVRDTSGFREPSEAEWIEVQKILSCVARVNGRFGRGRICQILLGSASQQITNFGLNKLSTYGLMRNRSEAYIKQILEQLILDGCVEISRGEYPVLSLTRRGRQVVQRKADLVMEWPGEAASRKTSGSGSKSGGSKAEIEARGLENPDLYQMLVDWRREEAKERKIPAFQIFSNRALRAIAAAAPTSEIDLQGVWGVGPQKIGQYASAVLDIVDEWTEKHA